MGHRGDVCKDGSLALPCQIDRSLKEVALLEIYEFELVSPAHFIC